MLNREFLFREMIYNVDSKLFEVVEQRRRNIISLTIKRNIFRVFFDNLTFMSRVEIVMSFFNDEDDSFIVSVSDFLKN